MKPTPACCFAITLARKHKSLFQRHRPQADRFLRHREDVVHDRRDEFEAIRHPAGTGQESALVATVGMSLHAPDETALRQNLLDLVDRRRHTRVVRRQKS